MVLYPDTKLLTSMSHSSRLWGDGTGESKEVVVGGR